MLASSSASQIKATWTIQVRLDHSIQYHKQVRTGPQGENLMYNERHGKTASKLSEEAMAAVQAE